MKKFRFKLKKLENSKRHFEQQKTLQLAQKKRVLDFEEMKLKHLWKLEKTIVREMAEKKVFLSTEMLSYYNYLNQIRRSKRDQETRVNDARNKMERARSELMKISREKKILEKLHERKYKEYIHDSNQEDQKIIDELATQSKARTKWQIQAQ